MTSCTTTHIESAAFDNDTIAIGMPRYVNGEGVMVGCVVVSDDAGKTVLEGTEKELFGWSVAISYDKVIVVGAPCFNGTAGIDCGRIAIYEHQDDGTYDLVPNGIIEGNSALSMFGSTITTDGRTIVVGEPLYTGTAGPDCGRVTVFTRQPDGSYIPTDSIEGDKPFKQLGWALGIHDGELVIEFIDYNLLDGIGRCGYKIVDGRLIPNDKDVFDPSILPQSLNPKVVEQLRMIAESATLEL